MHQVGVIRATSHDVSILFRSDLPKQFPVPPCTTNIGIQPVDAKKPAFSRLRFGVYHPLGEMQSVWTRPFPGNPPTDRGPPPCTCASRSTGPGRPVRPHRSAAPHRSAGVRPATPWRLAWPGDPRTSGFGTSKKDLASPDAPDAPAVRVWPRPVEIRKIERRFVQAPTTTRI